MRATNNPPEIRAPTLPQVPAEADGIRSSEGTGTMHEARNSRTTDQKLAIFQACFTGLKDVYGTYDAKSGSARQVKRPVTGDVLLRHLQGLQPYGVYLLVGNETRAVVADFDVQDPGPPLRFIRQAAHYGLRAYLERSKGKGWHAWIFMELPGVTAAKARLVVKTILDDIDETATEVFPKQDRLDGNTQYGNFIYAPLYGKFVFEDRTVFVDPEHELKAFANQWDFLDNIQRVTESQLDKIIEINGLDLNNHAHTQGKTSPGSAEVQSSFGLPPCAQRMLAEGVSQCQRVACFRLAVHLKKAGIPQDIAVAGLAAWASKNHPESGKRIITEAEVIEQTGYAYAKPYRACGCEDPAVMPFCQLPCPLKPSTVPKTSADVGGGGTPERASA